MKIEQTKYGFIRTTRVDESICNNIHLWLNGLAMVYDNYYQITGDSPFEYGERSQVGFLSEAIIRNSNNTKVAVLQEFGLKIKHEETKTSGRGDLLVSDEECFYLFEAKHWDKGENQSILNSEASANREWEAGLHAQAYQYFISEKEYYKRLPIFTISITFEPVRLKRDQQSKSFNDLESYELSDYAANLDFMSLQQFSGDDFTKELGSRAAIAMLVYGSVRKPR